MSSGEEGGPNSPPDTVAGGDNEPTTDSSENNPKTYGGGSKRVEGKKCGVCGDRALGYNFNAVTCESCKAFFRRNALKNKEFRCPFNDRCEVTSVTRRFCQRCRLKKCFEVGMKKEWIMSDEEKKKKKKKIEENRIRKLGDVPSSSVSETPQDNQSHLFNSSSNDHFGDSVNSSGEEPFSSAKPSKPQAVVVGRVRESEDMAARKIIKLESQSDVHTHEEHLLIMNQEQPKPSADISLDLQSSEPQSLDFSHQHQHHYSSAGSSYSFNRAAHSASLPTPCESALTPPKEGLMADLLRAHSHGSAEEEDEEETLHHIWDLEEISHRKVYDQGSPLSGDGSWKEVPQQVAGVLVKHEQHSDSDSCDQFSFNCSSVIEQQQQQQQQPQGLIHHAQPIHEEAAHNFASQSSSSQEKGFTFSIRETLEMLQPGCRDLPASPPSSGKAVMDSILNSVINAEYSGFTLLRNSDSLSLNPAETLKINELLEASRGLTAPLCEDANFKDLPNPSLINVINLTEIAIRRLIKMSKKIIAFKNLCQEDQIALLKSGCTEMLILRSVYAYDPDKDVWKIQQDHERFKSIKLKVLKAAPGNVYEEHKRFIMAFEPEWRQDMQILALLSAIALFTPQRQNVIHKAAIEHEQKSYFFLLKRYLESRYGGCVGKTNYYRLLKIIGDLHILNEDHVRVFLDVNPKDVEPLLIEIFDLKRT